jgi:hypothetical protein
MSANVEPMQLPDQARPQEPKSERGVEADRNQALGDAKFLLRHAAEIGLEPQSNVVCQIQVAEDANNQGKWTPQISESFWLAYSALCTAVKPVTAESLRACAGGLLHKTLNTYRKGTISLIVIILPLSVFLFVNTSISNEIGELIKENDALALTLRERINSLSAILISPGVTDEGSKTTQLQPVIPSSQSVRESDAITTLQQFATTNRVLYARANLLNRFILNLETDPLAKWLDENKKTVLELPVPLPLKDIPAVATYKLQWYQSFRAYAKEVQQSNLVVFGALTAYVLPILYALLGAFAYALRALSQEATLRTYVPSNAAFARIIIALIAGLVVGLFNNLTQGVSLSPLAIAFLVGYGVELFFSLLDAFLETLKKVRT